MGIQEDLGSMAHREVRVNEDLPETTETRESVATTVQWGQMDVAAREDKWEKKESKVPVGTEVPEESWVIQDLSESGGGRARLAPVETPASLARPALLATEGMKAHLDLKGQKDREESKDLLETEAQWAPREVLVVQETELLVVLVSRVTLGPVETSVSRVPKELLDRKETMEMPEILAQITVNQEL